MTRLGLLAFSTTVPEDLAATARRVEGLGFDELWIPEDYFFFGGLTAATIALAATERIDVGIGVLSGVVRHPAVTAMEVATLLRAFPGRLLTGIGHGVPFWVKQMGLYPKSPVTSMRAVVDGMRALLSGRTLTVSDGPFVFDNVTLAHPVDGPVPIYTGVIGPKSLELSGEIAEGTVMSVIAAPKYLEYAKTFIATGAARSGRDPLRHRIPTFAIYHVDEDGATAAEAARTALAFYLQAVGPTPMTGVYGINDQLGEILALGELDAIAGALPAEWVDTFTIAGTPERCAQKIAEFEAAGATSVVLAPFPAADAPRMLELTAERVMPLLSR
jgi:alkanesulfonate monooxygenase SsuD/methylene tetrahydromethanopterin reductase-like flavin-dependent oxidoreductase (luciferase family)